MSTIFNLYKPIIPESVVGKSSGQIDSRNYDDIFLLAKILMIVELTQDEKSRLLKHFEKKHIDKEDVTLAPPRLRGGAR